MKQCEKCGFPMLIEAGSGLLVVSRYARRNLQRVCIHYENDESCITCDIERCHVKPILEAEGHWLDVAS